MRYLHPVLFLTMLGLVILLSRAKAFSTERPVPLQSVLVSLADFCDNNRALFEQISDKHKEMLPEIVTLSEICEHKDMSSWRSLRDSPLVGPKAPPTPTPPAWFTEITTVLSVTCTLTSVILTIINTCFAPAAAQVQMMRNELSDAKEAFLRLTCDRLGREISLRGIIDRLDIIEGRLGIFNGRS